MSKKSKKKASKNEKKVVIVRGDSITPVSKRAKSVNLGKVGSFQISCNGVALDLGTGTAKIEYE